MYQLPNKDLSKIGLWYEVLKLFVRLFPKIIPFSCVLSIIAVGVMSTTAHNVAGGDFKTQFMHGIDWHHIGLSLIASVSYLILMILNVGWILHCLQEKTPNIVTFFRLVQAKMGAIVWTSVLYIGCVFIACCLVIPGFYLLIAWLCFLVLLWQEDRSGWHLLKSARALIKGHWWNTCLTMFCVAGLTYIVLCLLLLLFGVHLHALVKYKDDLWFMFISYTINLYYYSAVVVLVHQQLQWRKTQAMAGV
jgi:hypothetical protein